MFTKKAVLFVLIIGLTFTAFAQNTQQSTQQSSQQSSQTTATFSDKEKAEAKKQLGQLGEMFGVKKDQPQSAQTEEKPVTMAEVADKALNMVGNAVGTIAGIVQKVAPEVWEIMVRQQYAAAFGMLIGPFLFLVLLGICTVIIKKYWKKEEGFDKKEYFPNDDLSEKAIRGLITSLIPGVLALIFAGTLSYRIGDAVPMLINPKYYAVRDLLQMLLK